MEIVVNNGVKDSVRAPETAQEAFVHPATKQRGHYMVRTGKPVQVWDKAEKRLKWVQFSEVEPYAGLTDGASVFVINDGWMRDADFEELRQELLELRVARRRNRPQMAPKADIIKQACDELVISQAQTATVGDVSFHRPSRGMLIPRDAEWARAMAEEAKTSDLTALRPGTTRRYK